jgi:DNA topoisomerase-3
MRLVSSRERAVRVEDKWRGLPKLHDLPSLQILCGSRFGRSAGKTLEVAQELYDRQRRKIITYSRAEEMRYLPDSLISNAPRIVVGRRVDNPCMRQTGYDRSSNQ